MCLVTFKIRYLCSEESSELFICQSIIYYNSARAKISSILSICHFINNELLTGKGEVSSLVIAPTVSQGHIPLQDMSWACFLSAELDIHLFLGVKMSLEPEPTSFKGFT